MNESELVRQRFLEAFVMQLIKQSISLKYSTGQMKQSILHTPRIEIQPKKIVQAIPKQIDFEKIASFVKPIAEERVGEISVPVETVSVVESDEEQVPEESRGAGQEEVRDDVYDLQELHFPRPVYVQEIGEKTNLGEFTLEKVPSSEEGTSAPPEQLSGPEYQLQPVQAPEPAMPSIKTQQTPTFPWQQKQPAPLAIKTPFPKPLMKRPPLQRPNLQFQRPSVAPQMNVPVPSAPQIVKSQPQLPKPRAKTYPSIVEQITVFGLPKIDEFLEDPSVQSIECPGPEKPIIVSRGGMIETTRSTLKSEEIDRIMREISDKTRIPLTTGVFRAAVQGYLITAVISEFVGTRFVIQKKQVS